jgi:hypothetical protein
MSIIQAIFGVKKTPTTAAIAAEIERACVDYDNAVGKRDAALASIGTMTDDEHRAAEEAMESRRRAADRATARIAALEKAHADAVVAEAEAARIAAVETLRKRVEACRKANTEGAAKLLAEYDEHAERLADVLASLAAIDAERDAVNEALRITPVADSVVSYHQIHRKAPDRAASEQRAVREAWVYSDGSIAEAKRRDNGDLVPPTRYRDPIFGHDPQPKLEQREIVVGKTTFRSGHYEASLSAIMLPPAFAGRSYHWPRR